MTARSLDAPSQRSLRYSIRDAGAFSVMTGAGETYLSAFALHLKASAQELALLASIPPLLGSLTQLFSAWLGERGVYRKRLIVGGAVAQALLWLPLMLLPLAFSAMGPGILIVCVVLYQGAAHFITPLWGSLMRELVPQQRRGRFFARRTRICSFTAFISLILAGLVLYGFQRVNLSVVGFLLIFSVAATARLLSAFFLSRMHDPGDSFVARETLGQGLRSLAGSPFLRFSIFFALMQASVAIASPFFSLHMLRNLEFSYLEYMAGGAATVLAQFLTLSAWGRISDRFGNRLILFATGFMLPALPLLWTFSESFWYLLVVQATGGLAWAGFTLAAGNFVYDLLPDRRIAPYMAFHNVLMALGVFFGASVGGYLATHLPSNFSLFGHQFSWAHAIYGVFVISSLARLTVSATLLPRIREVREVEPMSVRNLIFRVTRFHAISGLVFEIVAGNRKRPPK